MADSRHTPLYFLLFDYKIVCRTPPTFHMMAVAAFAAWRAHILGREVHTIDRLVGISTRSAPLVSPVPIVLAGKPFVLNTLSRLSARTDINWRPSRLA